jgi:aspartate aminotransferase
MATTFTKNVFPYSGAASVIVAARTTVAPLRKSRTRPKQPKHTRRVTTTRTIDGSFITPSSIVTAASLSVLPTSSLLRSLFINSISSKPFLLGPSIFFLNLLCQSKDSFLFSVDRNKLLGWIVKKTIYKQFCAGENAEEVRNTMKEMKDLGFKGTILTYAKETVFDSRTNKVYGHGVATGSANQDGHCKSIEAWSKGALDTVEMLGSGDQLALK